ncbi:MAG: bifunctional oligoribonuclease/PAP phosphatase NrnA [Bacteroidales bacterium]|jgi:phosphoesterase RecJ-like protein
MECLFSEHLIGKWAEALDGSKRIVIATHINPDGDAVGSLVGLGLFLQEYGYQVTLVCPTPYPDFLSFLDPDKSIQIYVWQENEVAGAAEQADLIIAVDVSSFSRMEMMEPLMKESKAFKILIDHHIDPVNHEFDLVLSSIQVSSSAELIFRILKAWKPDAELSKNLATALLTGIVTDTNQFANSVFPGTFTVASALRASGADMEEIVTKVYRDFTINRMQLMGYALQNIKILPAFRTGYIVLTKDILEAYGYKIGDAEGFVNFPLAIGGIQVSAFFLQREDHIKVSLRSRGGIAVNEIARKFFNGGGHFNASAGKMENVPEKIEERLTEALGTIIVPVEEPEK